MLHKIVLLFDCIIMNLTPQINYAHAIKRWCQMVDEYNANCKTLTQTRTITLSTGKKVSRTFEMKQDTIKGSVKSTGMYLISQYADAWALANRSLHGMAQPADVYLKTNRVEMGKTLNRSPRSVYDHLQKLLSTGLVDKYEFCGRQHSFKLWISPKILFGAAEPAQTQIALNAPNLALSVSVRQKMPPSDTSLKKHSTTIRAVECGQTQKHNHGNNKDPHGPVEKSNETILSMPATETRGLGGGGGGAAYGELETAWRRLPKYLQQLTLQFWLLARTSLYRRNEWTNEENTAAVLEIYSGLFGRFAVTQSNTAWEDYYNELAERVTMAQQWFENNANRRPDMPFQTGKKMGYFDPKNNFGFKITATWLAKDKLRKRQNRVEYLLNQARIDFERLAQGKPRPSHIAKDEMQLFVYYQNWAKTYGKEAMEQFCQQYLDQKARNFAPKRPPRLTIRAQKAVDKAAAAEVVYVESWMTEMGEGFYSFQ